MHILYEHFTCRSRDNSGWWYLLHELTMGEPSQTWKDSTLRFPRSIGLSIAMWRMVEPQFFSSKHPDDLQVFHHFQDTHNICWCFFQLLYNSRFRVVGQTSHPTSCQILSSGNASNGVLFSQRERSDSPGSTSWRKLILFCLSPKQKWESFSSRRWEKQKSFILLRTNIP